MGGLYYRRNLPGCQQAPANAASLSDRMVPNCAGARAQRTASKQARCIVLSRRVNRVGTLQRKRIQRTLFIKPRSQSSEHKTLVAQSGDVRPVHLLVITNLSDGRVHGVSKIQHAKCSIAKTRTIRIDVRKGRSGVGTTGNTEWNIGAWYQLQSTSLIGQPRVSQRLQCVQLLKFIHAGNVIKDRNRWKLGINQPISANAGCR